MLKSILLVFTNPGGDGSPKFFLRILRISRFEGSKGGERKRRTEKVTCLSQRASCANRIFLLLDRLLITAGLLQLLEATSCAADC